MKLSNALNQLEDVVCPLLLAGFILLFMVQIAGRALATVGLPGWTFAGSEELARTAFLFFAYFSAAYAIKRSAHARLTLHLRRLPPLWRSLCLTAGDAAWLFFNLTLCVKSFAVIALLRAYPYTTTSLGWQLAWVFAIFPLVFGLMAVRIVQNRVAHWRHPEWAEDMPDRPGSAEAEPERAPWVLPRTQDEKPWC